MTGLKRRGGLLALLLAFALIVAACSSDDETTTTEAAGDMAGAGIKVGMAYDIGGRGDKSFNDSAAAGLDRAVTDFGVETEELEPTAGGENREENLRLLAESGFELIFAIGFAFAEGVGNTAPDFPDASFAIVDDSSLDLPNVASLVFAEHEGSALVGAAAALKSETGTIGFIGGVNTGLINKFEAGYRFGAEYINPDIDILTQYLTEPPDFSGFNDPAKGKEAALAMYEQGADVVYHAAGGSGGGLFEAAKETSEAGTKVWAIGVDSDQYETAGADVQEYILTSMLKRVDVAIYSTIEKYVNEGSVSGITVFDLSVDGVGYSTSGGFVDDIKADLDDLTAKIVSGELTVPETVEG
jgi:basic membrane protein A